MKQNEVMADTVALVIIFDYFGVLAHRYGQPDSELIDFIEMELAGRCRLAVLSNMSGGSAVDMLGPSAESFDEVITSGELGVAKPDRRAFLLAAQRLGEFPEDCILVDDSLVNCTSAEEVGMRSIHYQDFQQFQQELVQYGILTS